MSETTTGLMALALREAGYRLTKPRLAILQVLETSEEGLSPEEIQQRARTFHHPTGLVTVYRTLELLAELGLVQRVHTQGCCHEYACGGDERHHLICRGCGHVVVFPCDGLGQLLERVRARTGYRIDAHLLELTGLCPQCQREGE